MVVGTLGRKGSGEKTMQRKRTRTKRGTDSIGACRCAAITGALPLQVQSLYCGQPRRSVAVFSRPCAVAAKCSKCKSPRTPSCRRLVPFVPRARASCGNLRRPSVATVAGASEPHQLQAIVLSLLRTCLDATRRAAMLEPYHSPPELHTF